MPINWQDKAVQDRLLTAVIASVDNKISIAEIARLYGEDMTYHAVKNYLRKFRKEAKEMKGDVVDRPGPVPSPAKPRAKKTSTVSPVKAGVKSGRVTKNKAPTKVKTEILEESLELEGMEEEEEEEEEEEV